MRDDEEIEFPLDKDSFMSGYVEGLWSSDALFAFICLYLLILCS